MTQAFGKVGRLNAIAAALTAVAPVLSTMAALIGVSQ